MESKITEYVKCQQEILLHRYNAEHTKIIIIKINIHLY